MAEARVPLEQRVKALETAIHAAGNTAFALELRVGALEEDRAPAPRPIERTCIGCGCTDRRACQFKLPSGRPVSGCRWISEDVDVCDRCMVDAVAGGFPKVSPLLSKVFEAGRRAGKRRRRG